MIFALHIETVPRGSSVPSPSPAHTLSHLSTLPAVSHAVSQSPPPQDTPTPSPTADSLIADWLFQVTSDLFPCLPNITGWPRPRNPAWAREGVEVHTHKHMYMQKKRKEKKKNTSPHTLDTNRSDWCRALLHTQLNTFQLILWLSMVVWLCEDTYLPCMYPTERQININARKTAFIQPL